MLANRKTFALYGRVSTSAQEEGTPPQTQRADCARPTASEGYEVDADCVDREEESGESVGRP